MTIKNKIMVDIDKFQWRQMFNNSKGKTSGMLVGGFLTLVFGLIGFAMAGNAVLIMVVFKLEKDGNVINFMTMLTMQSIVVIGTGAGMLGMHRFTKDKEITLEKSE